MICWFVGIYIKWRPNVRSDCWSMTKVIFWGGLLLELVQTAHQQKTPRGDCRAVVNLQNVQGNLKKSLSKATYILYVFWIDSFASACHNLLTLLCSGPSIASQLSPTKARQSRSLATHQMATQMFLENTQKAISKMTCRQQIALQPDPDWDLANNRPNLKFGVISKVSCIVPRKSKKYSFMS